ncbi:MAG: hypothetical protein ACFFD4_05345 [Candidatus Odinarchaeota archaeon]
MELGDILEKKHIVVIDPYSERDPSTFEVDTLMVEIAEQVEEVALVTKSESGKVLYKSMAAPRDSRFPDYFPSFVQLANDLGIKVHAFIYAHGDSFMGAQRGYSVLRSGSQEVREFVCPSQKSYWKYLSTVAREVARFPVDSVIFSELMYPRQEYCFCQRCRREFSDEYNASFEVTFSELANEPEYYDRFVDWRSELIGSTLSEIFDSARRASPNPDLRTGLVLPLDPETGWVEGARVHHGLDLPFIGDVSRSLVLHVMPWSPLYPEPGTDTWNAMVSTIKGMRRIRSDFELSLYIWGVQNEFNIDWLDQLKDEVKAEHVFVRLDTPPLYNIKREITRGLY